MITPSKNDFLLRLSNCEDPPSFRVRPPAGPGQHRKNGAGGIHHRMPTAPPDDLSLYTSALWRYVISRSGLSTRRRSTVRTVASSIISSRGSSVRLAPPYTWLISHPGGITLVGACACARSRRRLSSITVALARSPISGFENAPSTVAPAPDSVTGRCPFAIGALLRMME